MYINGLYVNGIPYVFQRVEGYKGVDIIISTLPSFSIKDEAVKDYEGMGSNGYCIWGPKWPSELSVLGPDERVPSGLEISKTSSIGKELLFFRKLSLNNKGGLTLIHSLGYYMNPLNVGFVIRQLVSVSKQEESQLLLILDIGLYESYKVSSCINSNYGLLII